MFGEFGQAKILDFGVAHVLENPESSDIVNAGEGTYHFMAPEKCDPDIDEYHGKPLDVWSLGVTLYCLLFLELPFNGKTEHLIMEDIRTRELEIPKTREVSPELIEILLQLCEKDPEKRITLEKLFENECFLLDEEEVKEDDEDSN